MRVVFASLLTAAWTWLAIAPVRAADTAPGAATETDCVALNAALVEDIRAGRYIKPDDDNAMRSMATLRRAGCAETIDDAWSEEAAAGAQATAERLEAMGREAELCPVMRFLGDAALPRSPREEAFWRRHCAGHPTAGPPSTWTEVDRAAVQKQALDHVARQRTIDAADRASRQALDAGNIHDAGGDNAIEHALRGRALARSGTRHQQVRFEVLLDDLAFHTLAAAHGAANLGDRIEFDRLRALLIRIDPDMPELQTLRERADAW